MRDTVWQVAREPWTHWYAPACRALTGNLSAAGHAQRGGPFGDPF
ncbi:hypothetical protein ACFQ1L_24280 [Phytohabitans flavus]